MDIKSKIVLISGPTASGKSNFAVKIAKKIDGEIINTDSMQVYKQLKILTARPNKKEKENVKHHLYGIVNVSNNFSTGQWLKLATKNIRNIRKRKKIPILVGGTGLYFQSLINGLVKIPNIPIRIKNQIRSLQKKIGQRKFYKQLLKIDPKVQNKLDPNDAQRSIRAFEVMYYTKISMYDWFNKTKSNFKDKEFIKLYISFDKDQLAKRILERTTKMIKSGAIQEVKRFNKLRVKKENSANKVIGIEELSKYLNNKIKIEEAKELIAIRTRQYAKRQATWARSKMFSWNIIESNEILLSRKKSINHLLNLTN